MECEILYTDEFASWWDALSTEEQISIAAVVGLLKARGVTLGFRTAPRSLWKNRAGLRELRIQHQGRPFRVLYAFEPKRRAVLLLGGDKTGQERWYEIFVPLADRIYAKCLEELKEEEK